MKNANEHLNAILEILSLEKDVYIFNISDILMDPKT